MTVIRSFVAATAILVLGTTTLAQAPQVPSNTPVVVTRGEATVKRAPDRAWLTVATETRDGKAEDARRKAAEVMTDVQSALRRAGVPGDALRTTGFSLTPEINYNNGRGEIRGYVVRNRVEVRVDDLEKLGTIIDAAQTRSATGLSIIGPRFDLKNERDAQNEAVKLAVQAARARAEAMASGAGRSLGSILRIEEGYGMPIPLQRQETMAFRGAASAADAVDTPVTPGEIEVQAMVLLTVEIR